MTHLGHAQFAEHLRAARVGFTIGQGGGSASFSVQNGHADSNYAGVNEQAGIYAGDGGFNVNVKGNTGLTGAVISSTADESKNSLTTGTLTRWPAAGDLDGFGAEVVHQG